MLEIDVAGLSPSSRQAAKSIDTYDAFALILAVIAFHLWLVKPSIVVIGDNPKEFVIEKLVIRDCFKELFHGDEDQNDKDENGK